MRALEFVVEARRGKLHPDHDGPMTTAYTFRDEGIDRAYNLNRIMMAAAMADGKSTKPIDIVAAGWNEKNNTAHPYTQEEHNMLKSAFATIPSNTKNMVSDHRST